MRQRPRSARSARRGFKSGATFAFESLEARCLLSTTVAWHTTGAFDQFTGGAPTILGFGVDDGEPDANHDGISDASGIPKNPRFAGYQYDTGTSVTNFAGGDVSASASGKIGISYGYYINGGSATTLHSGTFTYNVAPIDASGKIGISTSEQTVTGDLFTASPTLSAFADLIAQFNSDVAVTNTLNPFIGPQTLHVPIHVNLDTPLASINRQVMDANGKPEFNSNGTPKFDGDINVLGSGLTGAQTLLTNLLHPGESGIESQYQDDLNAEQASITAEEMAKVDLAVATANNDAAGMQAAQAALTAAQAKGSAATADAAKIQSAVVEIGKTGAQIGGGEILQGTFGTADGPLLGIQATVGVGVGVTDAANVGETLGSAALTLPQIDLVTRAPDTNGVLAASTSDPAFMADPDLVARQQVANISLNLGALIGGIPSISVGPISLNVTLLNYMISFVENVTQNVSLTPSSSDNLVDFSFEDPVTKAPVATNAFINGVESKDVLSITFHAGDQVQIQPAPGTTVQVMPSLRHSYTFQNTLGGQLTVNGEFQLLGLSASVFSKTVLSGGYLFDSGSSPLASTDLGPIWSSAFSVDEKEVTLSPFNVVGLATDLQLVTTSSPGTTTIVNGVTTYPLTFTFQVTNAGPFAANNVVFTDSLPGDFAFNAARSTIGTSVSNGVASLSIGTLAVGATRTITIGVDATVLLSLTNFSDVAVTSSTPDPQPTNNETLVRTDFSRLIQFLVQFYDEDPTSPISASPFDSLRSFAFKAEQNPGPDRISYVQIQSPNPGPLVQKLTLGEVVFTQSIEIDGSPLFPTIIDANNKSRIFRFGGVGQNNYILFRLDFKNGTGTGTGGFDGMGGAIELDDPDGSNPAMRDTLTIVDCSFENNSALTGNGFGGAINVHNGTLIIRDSTFTNNSAQFGGAIHLENSVATFTKDVSVLNNSASSAGGGVFVRANSGEETDFTSQNSLFSDNKSPAGDSIRLKSAANARAQAFYSRSIFTGGGSTELSVNANGGVANLTSQGNNVSDDTSGNLTAPGDLPKGTAGITLSNLSVVDGPAGSSVGVLGLVDPRFPDTPTFTVNDPRFTIDGNTLKLKPGQTPLTTTGGMVPITVTATDDPYSVIGSFVLTIVPQNLAPTDISLSLSTVFENAPGALIGNVAAADPNTGDSATFSVDDTRFEIVNGVLKLKAKQALDFESEPSVLLKITARDHGGLTFTKPFTVTVLDVNETPTRILFDGTSLRGKTDGAVVGKVEVTDPDKTAIPPTITVNDPRFEVVDGVLKLKSGQSLDRTTTPSVNLVVTATDSGGLSITAPLQVRVIPTVALATAPGIAYREQDPSIPLAESATVQGVPGDSFKFGELIVRITQNAQPADQLELTNLGTGPGQVFVSGGVVSVGGKRIGTIQGGVGTTPLAVVFDTADATSETISALIRDIGFRVDGQQPLTVTRTIAFTLVDPEGAPVAVGAPIQIGVIDLKHFTFVAPATDLTVKPGANLALKNGNALRVLAGPLNRPISVVISVTAGSLTPGTVKGLKITGKGKATLTLTGTLAQVNAALLKLTFKAPRKSAGPIHLTLTATDLGPASPDAIVPGSTTFAIRLTSGKGR